MTLQWTCSKFVCDTLIQLRDEIKQVLQDREEVTDADVDQMPYLRKVMQESLRIFPVIPAVSRTSLRDTVITDSKNREIRIPAGVDVLMPIIAMHRSEENWVDAQKFNPDR